MRSLVAIYIMVVYSLGALEQGKRYDFFCNDSQDIFNAEYVSEDNTRYFVKLSNLVTSVPIEKALVRHIQESNPTDLDKKNGFVFTGLVGAIFATGRLVDFAGFAPTFSLSLQRQLVAGISAIVRIDALRFQREKMSLTLLSVLPGVEYSSHYSFASFTSAMGLVLGGAYTHGITDTTTIRALIPAAVSYLALRRNLTGQMLFILSISVAYFHDKLNPLILPGILAGVEYRL